MDEHSGGGGSYSRVKDEDILDVFFQAHSPALSTSEVAEYLPIGADQTRRRLDRLENEGFVHSKQIGKPKIWWHDEVQLLFEDDSGRASTMSHLSNIGVEVIDSLDLPGGGLDLHARRLAVDAVFQYLFEHGEASKSTLSGIAWEADTRQTYASAENLWNNCVHEALGQVPFFVDDQNDGKWILFGLGETLRNKYGTGSLWENWAAIKFNWKHVIYESFWGGINQNINPEQSRLEPTKAGRRSYHIIRIQDLPYDLRLEIKFTTPFWLKLAGDLQVQLTVTSDSGKQNPLEGKFDSIKSGLSFPVEIEQAIDGDHEHVTITTSQNFELDPNDVSLGKIRNKVNPLSDTSWLEMVGEEFFHMFNGEFSKE